MEILSKLYCKKCDKSAYPRPNVRQVIVNQDGDKWLLMIKMQCAYCNEQIGTFIGELGGETLLPSKPEVND
jgi:hypothetical protein